MQRIVECVPNFSEGRKRETIAQLVHAIEAVDPARVLDVHIDADHNRSVITFIAAPETVVDAAVAAVKRASELIDLRTHAGEHPRFGACDVLPFVPLKNVTMDECVRFAHEAGERIANELKIPVFYYENVALRPERTKLEDVRRGGYELLREEIGVKAERAPDAGERKIHESAGAIAVGAREILIAFNVNLQTDDVRIAKEIARRVRGSSGGLKHLKALGIMLHARRTAQVSMNLVAYERTGLLEAYTAVQREAVRLGVEIAGSEIVGLVPRAALPTDNDDVRRLQIENFSPAMVLEDRIGQVTGERRDV